MGNFLEKPITEKTTTNGKGPSFSYAHSSMQGWRKSMEDSHIETAELTESSSLFGVYDGHGGREVALFISKHLPSVLLEDQQFQQGDYQKAFENSYLKLDQLLQTNEAKLELHSLADKKPLNFLEFLLKKKEEEEENEKNSKEKQQQGNNNNNEEEEEDNNNNNNNKDTKNNNQNDEKEDKKSAAAAAPVEEKVNINELRYGISSGATAVSALLLHNHNKQEETDMTLYVANSGDSRAVFFDGKQVIPMSFDHKPMDKIERDRIYKAGSIISGGRVGGDLNLSRAIGDLSHKQNLTIPAEEQAVTAFPDVKSLQIPKKAPEGSEARFLILACDGIWDVLSNADAVEFVQSRLKKQETLPNICEQILDTCLATDCTQDGTDNMTVVIVHFD